MEAQQQQQNQQQQQQNDDGGSGKSGFLCRQSSTRWTPTTEQIRILKDLYYNNGVRSPSADQIQKISAKLRQYGKIEGKNVFYWFQNHKARERQKKRLTTDNIVPMQQRSAALWRNEESFYSSKYPNNICASSSSTCAPGLTSACAQVGNYAYGSSAMEKSFRDCSLSAGFNVGNGAMAASNFSWVGADPNGNPSLYPFLEKRASGGYGEEELQEEEEEDVQEVQEIETLPLFPMHGEDISGGFNKQQQHQNWYYPASNWYHQYSNGGNMACSRASLELSLNSYGGSRSNNSP